MSKKKSVQTGAQPHYRVIHPRSGESFHFHSADEAGEFALNEAKTTFFYELDGGGPLLGKILWCWVLEAGTELDPSDCVFFARKSLADLECAHQSQGSSIH